MLNARLIDEAFQTWDTAHMSTDMLYNFQTHMSNTMRFGSLEWEVESLSRKTHFLDLTITLETDGSISTTTYVKPMNLNLYLPPTSAHPRGVLKSLIFGTLHRCWIQNSRTDQFTSATAEFMQHLLNRGYTHEHSPHTSRK